MAPVLVLNAKPLGRLGLISQDVTAPPLTDGVLVVIAEPLVRVIFSGVYPKAFGTWSLMVMLT